ncbi:MAG: hypothetical protein ACI4XB_08705, partial [Ruminococcus sp.]
TCAVPCDTCAVPCDTCAVPCDTCAVSSDIPGGTTRGSFPTKGIRDNGQYANPLEQVAPCTGTCEKTKS